MSNLSKKILHEIDEKKIEPKEKWFFVVKKYIWYFLLAFVVIFCSIVFALTLVRFFSIDFDLMDKFARGKFMFIVLSMPYFWFFIIGAMILLAYYFYRHTEFGYKKSNVFVVIGILIVFVLTGGIIFFTGISDTLEEKMAKNKIYQKLDYSVNRLWSSPEDGFLAGTILERKSNKMIILSDLNSKVWEIDLSNAVLKKNVNLMKGDRVKLLGEIVSKDKFHAFEVRLWVGCGMLNCHMR